MQRQPQNGPTNYQGQAPVNTLNPLVKSGPGRKNTGLLVGLGILGALIVVGLVVVVVLLVNKPAPPPANTTPISGLFPFNNLTPTASTSAGISTTISSTTPGATTPAGNGGTDVDSLYNQAQTELKNSQFKEAAATLEQLRTLQTQTGNNKHPDVPALLFRAYLDRGDQLNKAAKIADFQLSIEAYQKALDTAKTLDAKDRNQQEESAVQSRIELGNLYILAYQDYNQKNYDAVVPLFSQIYNKDQNFREASTLYYDALTKIGDG
jgi:hypothetical protein